MNPSKSAKDYIDNSDINSIFEDLLGQDIIVILDVAQLNILGQTFRPIFTGTLVEVRGGSIRLDPAIIKMPNAPNFVFPTPLCFPIENIAIFAPFDLDARLTLS
ncbi:hypothetical protein [Paenibacillus gallinarum]|uniref:hypothetical protein n=1 Tax=Paenibacillus gallinarum TaxID=2762232 RepID=UPI001CD88560|nr:hypothetical protein [Paenibacillus gallinarum]